MIEDLFRASISVALVTRNRPESLNRCLESLRSQSVQPFEVVVSDDSDPDLSHRTKDIVKRWDCRYITGPRRGLYANRNHAALACKGTHVRTMDDDHEFPEEHFQIVQTLVASDPASIWIMGEYWEQPTPSSVFHLPGEIQPRGFSKLPCNLDDSFAISDGASIYPRQIFENHRYLEVFKFGSLYLEYGGRLKALGYCIRCCVKTYIIHHYVPEKRSFNDEGLQCKSAFLASYLTYSYYNKNIIKKVECLSYFLIISLLTTFKIKPYSFHIFDFWQTWLLGNKYENIFKAGKYQQMI